MTWPPAGRGGRAPPVGTLPARCGFDPPARAPGGHYGLDIMRERAERAGGTLSIERAPGHGTTVTLRVPLQLEGGKAVGPHSHSAGR